MPPLWKSENTEIQPLQFHHLFWMVVLITIWLDVSRLRMTLLGTETTTLVLYISSKYNR